MPAHLRPHLDSSSSRQLDPRRSPSRTFPRGILKTKPNTVTPESRRLRNGDAHAFPGLGSAKAEPVQSSAGAFPFWRKHFFSSPPKMPEQGDTTTSWARTELARIAAQSRVLDDEYQRALKAISRDYAGMPHGDRMKAEIAEHSAYRRSCGLLDGEARAVREYEARHPPLPPTASPSSSSASTRSSSSCASSSSTSATSYSSAPSSRSKLSRVYAGAGSIVVLPMVSSPPLHPTPRSVVSSLFLVPTPAPALPIAYHPERMWYPGMQAYREEYGTHFGARHRNPNGPPFTLLDTALVPPRFPDWACVLQAEAEEEHAARVAQVQADFVRRKVEDFHHPSHRPREEWIPNDATREAVARLESAHFEQLMSMHEEHYAVFFSVLRSEFARQTGHRQLEADPDRLLEAISYHHMTRPRLTAA